MTAKTNYYDLLGIPTDADNLQIKNALRARAKQIADKSSPLARQLKEAYDVLTDPQKRSRYDAGLVQDRGAVSAPKRDDTVKWEYLTLKSSRNYGTTKYYINDDQQRELKNAQFSEVINMIGQQGWEMVGISSMGTEQVYVFKRALNGD
ncbi:MAG: J domain-containing protein [Anaerolineaceae bacterium]|nr:MAG: J domain-containing protein [Anaerolineaceae bacterium]